MLGFIGTGNMGGAILRGVLAAGMSPANVVFTRKMPRPGGHRRHRPARVSSPLQPRCTTPPTW